MKKKLGLSVLLMSSLLIGITSCDKDDDDKTKAVTCKISSIVSTGTSTSTVALKYDEGRLATTTTAGGAGSSKLFNYAGNTITIVDRNAAGAVTGSNEVLLNENGKIVMITVKNINGHTTNTITYTYNTDGNLSMAVNTPITGSADTSLFIFSGGNLQRMVAQNSDLTDYTYYTDKAFLDGDFLKTAQMVNYGALALINKNLLKSITTYDPIGNPQVTNLSYEYDSKGKLTRIVGTGNTSFNYSYTYDCK
ncbi:MAG TPA: hypothetical protein VL098_13605 [Flavipsychrobacter sp.]|nr:hypothetical protein [Flavipsychrobacter sp.]